MVKLKLGGYEYRIRIRCLASSAKSNVICNSNRPYRNRKAGGVGVGIGDRDELWLTAYHTHTIEDGKPSSAQLQIELVVFLLSQRVSV